MALYALHVGYHFAVGTELVAFVHREFLFVYPVGDTIEYFVELAVGSHLRLAVVKHEFHQMYVVVANECNHLTVGRERWYLLGASVREWHHLAVLHIIYIILCCKRTAVYVVGFCLDKDTVPTLVILTKT